MPDLIALLDTETTGLKSDARVCEIAIAVLDLSTGTLAKEPRGMLVDPEVPMPHEAVKMHGITDAMVRGKPTLAAVWPRILHYVGDCPVVAHCADFDRRMIAQSLAVHGMPEAGWTWHCSRDLARMLMPDLQSYKLQDLARALGLPTGTAHRAMGDVRTLCGLMLHLRGVVGDWRAMVGS